MKSTRRCASCRQEKPSAAYHSPRARKCEACKRAGVRTCVRCHRRLPAEAFGAAVVTGTGHVRGASRICETCQREGKPPKRRRTTRLHYGIWRRVCPACGEEKRLERDFYLHRPGAKTIYERYGYECKLCQRKRVAAYNQRKREEDLEGQRRKRWAWAQSWRKRNPEKYREAGRRYRQRVQADPARRARKLENQRIASRLRAERAGRKLSPGPSTGVMPPEPQYKLPAAPFVALVERILEREMAGQPSGVNNGGASTRIVLQSLGVDERRWRLYRDGQAMVAEVVVDRVLTHEGLNLWDIYDPEEYPEAAALLEVV